MKTNVLFLISAILISICGELHAGICMNNKTPFKLRVNIKFIPLLGRGGQKEENKFVEAHYNGWLNGFTDNWDTKKFILIEGYGINPKSPTSGQNWFPIWKTEDNYSAGGNRWLIVDYDDKKKEFTVQEGTAGLICPIPEKK